MMPAQARARGYVRGGARIRWIRYFRCPPEPRQNPPQRAPLAASVVVALVVVAPATIRASRAIQSGFEPREVSVMFDAPPPPPKPVRKRVVTVECPQCHHTF